MRYILTLNNISLSDLNNVGIRAMDLAVLKEKRLNIPLTFVVNNLAFEEFMAENDLKQKIDDLLKEKKPADAYPEILTLFKNAKIPSDIYAELADAYDSLTIEPGSDAGSIVSKWDLPFVTIFRSPTHLLPTEDNEGIYQNIREIDCLAEALKQAWASFYSPRSIIYREKIGVKQQFSAGVIVQKMRKITHTVITYSKMEDDERTIVVDSFIGLPDYGFSREVLGKDHYEVDLNSLSIRKSEINSQEYSIVRDPESEELARHELGEEGASQKVNDRMISEIARITKRSKSFIERDIKMYLGVNDDYVFIFLANRMIAGPKRILEIEEAMEVKIEGKEEKIISHEQKLFMGQQEAEETFKMPPILSSEEVKAQLLKEKKVIGWDDEVEEAEEIEEPLRVEVFEEKTKQEETVEKEVNLLEEVLKIKEVTERMEEHALNNNKESYEKEARVLKGMIQRIREEEKQ